MDESEPLTRATLRAILDRIIPQDEDPGATDLGVDDYVLAQLAGDARTEAESIRAGVKAVLLASARRFPSLGPMGQDGILAQFETQPWFRVLCELAAEGFYADPGNGGNRDARSWAMIGYQHRLPEGPSGPVGGG